MVLATKAPVRRVVKDEKDNTNVGLTHGSLFTDY